MVVSSMGSVAYLGKESILLACHWEAQQDGGKINLDVKN